MSPDRHSSLRGQCRTPPPLGDVTAEGSLHLAPPRPGRVGWGFRGRLCLPPTPEPGRGSPAQVRLQEAVLCSPEQTGSLQPPAFTGPSLPACWVPERLPLSTPFRPLMFTKVSFVVTSLPRLAPGALTPCTPARRAFPPRAPRHHHPRPTCSSGLSPTPGHKGSSDRTATTRPASQVLTPRPPVLALLEKRHQGRGRGGPTR